MSAVVDLRMHGRPALRIEPSGCRPLVTRREVEATIERLIALLDDMDDDGDWEDDGCCEPSLGWLTSGGHSWQDGNSDLEEIEVAVADTR